MQTETTRTIVFLFLVAGFARPAMAQVDQQRAQEFFKAAQALCERDGGRLWGVSVCGPMVIGDRRTQTFATSQPAPGGARPALLGIVNAPIEWGGATWAAYVWDDASNRTPQKRNELLLHELFHIVQPQLGLTVPARATEHLDAADGRYWMRLEWRALAQALRDSGEQRRLAARDALAFRHARRLLYPASVDDERGQEITEGIASYTGTVLAAPTPSDAIVSALDLLATAEAGESFVRTFAYITGPAYGLLLDALSPGWTRRVRGTDDLSALVMDALAVQPPTDATAAAIRYGGAEILASERKREQERQERLADLRRRFVDGPVLRIPGGGSGMSDSRGAVVIPGVGTVYFGAYRAGGAWGMLEAEKGVLVASDGSSRRVPAPVRRDDGTFAGAGWTFKPAAGWVVREGSRRGDYEVVRQQQQSRSPIQRVDHIMIRTDRPAALFALFTDTLRLPVAWPLANRGGVVSGGAGFGNVIIEAIKFPDQVGTPAATHIVGFGFKPTALSESLAELTRRGITHGEPRPFVSTTPDGTRQTFFTNVTLQQFSDSDRPGTAATHIFLSEYNPAYVDVDRRRVRLRSELASTGGGPLGVTGVKEIILGTTNPATATRLWQSVLDPTHPSTGGGFWQIGDGPGIRVVNSSDNLVQGLVITVRSLPRATEILQQWGMLGAASATEATFAPPRIHGLIIRLIQDSDSAAKGAMKPPRR